MPPPDNADPGKPHPDRTDPDETDTISAFAAESADEGAVGFLRRNTLADLARRAGVSIKSVSRVLNEEPHVTAEMRRKVLLAAEELEYVPDGRARMLRTNRSGYIGLIVPDIRNGFFDKLISSIEKRLDNANQMMLLGISNELAEKEERYLRLFRQHRIDGLLVLPSGAAGLLDAARRVPMVVLERTTPALAAKVDHVLVNNRSAADALTSHLIEYHQLQQVCMIGGETSVSSVLDRQDGYRDAIRRTGHTEYSSIDNYSAGDAAEGAYDLFRRMTPPFGVFATGNRMFWGSMTAISRLGLRVPRDVRVAMFDGVGQVTATGLMPTQAVSPVDTMAARSLQLLTERGQQPDRPVRTVHLDCDIEYGVTCGCVDLQGAQAVFRR